MLEKDVESQLRNKIKELGGKAFKWVSPGNAGVPDRIILLPGERIYFVETKKPKGKTRVLQDRQIEHIRALGFEVLVLDSKEGVNRFISKLKGELEDGNA